MSKDSIYFEKCECGKPINYWKLRAKLINENRKATSKLFAIMMLILFIGLSIGMYKVITFDHLSSNYPYELGIMFGIFIGTLIGMAVLSIRDFQTIKNYDPKFRKKWYYRRKVRWAYYHSLSKAKRRSLISAYAILFSIVVIPYFAIVIGMLYFMGDTISEQGIIAIIIGYILYFAWWKIDPLMKFMIKWVERNLKSKGIDYQRFNRGVKSIES